MLPVVSDFYGYYTLCYRVLMLADKCCECCGATVDPVLSVLVASIHFGWEIKWYYELHVSKANCSDSLKKLNSFEKWVLTIVKTKQN